MAIFVFVLGSLLTVLGFGGLIASVDLLPTEVGILYAGCGTVAATSGLIVISIGALIRRVDALGGTFGMPSPEPSHFETLASEPEHDPPLAHSRADMMVDILSAPAYPPRRPAREIHRPRLLRAGSASPDLIANCHVTSPHVGCPNSAPLVASS